jgi:phosphate-selective porin
VLALLAAALGAGTGRAAAQPADSARARPAEEKAWYERLSLRGYTQVRYNGLLRTNRDLACAQCDRTLGRNGGLSLRRVRLVLSGDVSDRVSIYVQPDFASDVNGTLSVGQLRDAYADVALDRARTWRVRLGQSKIPFGWENMQSSSNRIPLDRADALNSALPNERDVAALVYWAPTRVRELLEHLVDSGLKGSGDYGALGVGVFNGQGTNRPEANDGLHTAARFAWPFAVGRGRYAEVGVQGYAGRYVLTSSLRTPGVSAASDYADARAAATVVLYPQPFGLQAEWNVGRGPEFDPATRTVVARRLDGGYVEAQYRLRRGGATLLPYVRAQRYDGGKKFELDARRHRVRELDVGLEWQPARAFELTAEYLIADRTTADLAAGERRQRGRVLRLQAQLNY